jgi:hypothetical protein
MRSSEVKYTELTAILHSEAGHAHGSYNSFDAWSVSLRGRAGSVGSRLVTAHEAMHATLNDLTAYGVLLAACVALDRSPARHRDGDEATAQLACLVETCRGTHEAFATFKSLWIVANADTSWLAGYPRYEGWFKDASDLVAGPDSSPRKELMVEAAVLACMQAPVLERLVEDTGSVSRAWSPLRLDRPDERFALLHGVVDDKFWSKAWARCGEVVKDAELVHRLEQPSLPEGRIETDLPDGLETACVQALYSEVARLLRRHRAETLDYDGHRQYGDAVIAAVEREGASAGVLIASRDDRPLADEVFELWQRERLVIRDHPRGAVLRRFPDIVRSGRMDVISEMQGTQHVFASVRSAGRLMQQFALDEGDAEVLREAGWETVVTLRSLTSAGVVELTVVDEPSQMADLARVLPRGITAYCNMSLAFGGDDAWSRQWMRSLRRWRLSALFDLSPTAQFDLWRRNREKIRFASTALGADEGGQGTAIVLRVGRSDLPLVMVCSAVAGKAIERYLSSQMPKAKRDRSVAESAGLDVPINHILTEEHFVDFAAYS